MALEPLARLECFIVRSTSERNVAARTDRSPEGRTTHTRRVICTLRLLIQPDPVHLVYTRRWWSRLHTPSSPAPSPPRVSTLLDYTSTPLRPSLLFSSRSSLLFWNFKDSQTLGFSPGEQRFAVRAEKTSKRRSMGGDRIVSRIVRIAANQFPRRDLYSAFWSHRRRGSILLGNWKRNSFTRWRKFAFDRRFDALCNLQTRADHSAFVNERSKYRGNIEFWNCEIEIADCCCWTTIRAIQLKWPTSLFFPLSSIHCRWKLPISPVVPWLWADPSSIAFLREALEASPRSH